MQFLITAIVGVILLVGVAASCPSVCSCTSDSNRVHVNCSSRGLHSIPGNLSTNTYVLDLHQNKITSIKSDTFNNLAKLKVLYLHQNKIASIKSDTFNNLTNLYRLDLDNNDISVIEDNNFNNLPNLEHLYLHENRITSIKSNTFNNLSNLNRLDLDHNYISVIEDNNFNHLPKLEILYLHNNTITSIKSDTFSNLTNLKKLWLRSNPISVVEENAFNTLPNLKELKFDMYCASCDNIPFWRWLTKRRTFTTYIYCNDFHGKKLSSLRNFNDDCTGNDGNGSVWCSRHGDWTCLVYMFFMISLQYIMSNI